MFETAKTVLHLLGSGVTNGPEFVHSLRVVRAGYKLLQRFSARKAKFGEISRNFANIQLCEDCVRAVTHIETAVGRGEASAKEGANDT